MRRSLASQAWLTSDQAMEVVEDVVEVIVLNSPAHALQQFFRLRGVVEPKICWLRLFLCYDFDQCMV